MISIRRLILSLVFIVGCAQDDLGEGGATERVMAQVASTGARDWGSLGGTVMSGPSICSWGVGRLDIFVRGADNAVWTRTLESETWSEWKSLGGAITYDPAAVSWAPGRIDLFARGREGALYRKVFENGAWGTTWENLGGALTSSPAVTTWGPGRIDVFARGGSGNLYHKSFETGWTSWVSVGSLKLISDPAATSWGRGRIDVVARGASGDLHHIWLDAGRWSAWTSLGRNLFSVRQGFDLFPFDDVLGGGALTPAPALATWGPGRLDLFAAGEDGALWQRSHSNGVWSEPASLGGRITSAPDAVSWSAGQIDLVARSSDNTLVYKYFDGSW